MNTETRISQLVGVIACACVTTGIDTIPNWMHLAGGKSLSANLIETFVIQCLFAAIFVAVGIGFFLRKRHFWLLVLGSLALRVAFYVYSFFYVLSETPLPWSSYWGIERMLLSAPLREIIWSLVILTVLLNKGVRAVCTHPASGAQICR